MTHSPEIASLLHIASRTGVLGTSSSVILLHTILSSKSRDPRNFCHIAFRLFPYYWLANHLEASEAPMFQRGLRKVPLGPRDSVPSWHRPLGS